jgi:hypothetical protein
MFHTGTLSEETMKMGKTNVYLTCYMPNRTVYPIRTILASHDKGCAAIDQLINAQISPGANINHLNAIAFVILASEQL